MLALIQNVASSLATKAFNKAVSTVQQQFQPQAPQQAPQQPQQSLPQQIQQGVGNIANNLWNRPTPIGNLLPQNPMSSLFPQQMQPTVTPKQAFDTAASLWQSPARFGAGVGLSTFHPEQSGYTPDNPFTKLLMGEERVKNLQGQGRDNSQFLQGMGVNSNVSNTMGLPLVLAAGAMDVLPGGGVKKKVIQKGVTEAAPLIDDAGRVATKVFNAVGDTLKEAPLSLPRPSTNPTIKQVQQLLKQGDNLDGVNFVAKNSNEAKRAFKAGVPTQNIQLQGKSGTPSQWFAGEEGLSRAIDPAQELLEQSVTKGAKTTKGLNWVSENTLEPMRAIPKMLGEVADTAKRAVFEPFEKAKGDSAIFQKEWVKKVADAVPFRAGSKESAAIQRFGEKVDDYDTLVSQFGKEKADEIVRSDTFFRQVYDEVLDTVNTRRVADGLEAIAKRDDYYRHFTEGGSNWLETLLTGNTGNSALSSSIMKQRKGDKTVFDAVAGFGEYIQKAGRAGYTDAFASKVQHLSKQLQKNGADPKVTRYLDKYAKEGILGERDVKDMGTILNTATSLVQKAGRQVKINSVLFNARSLIMQVANVPQAFGKLSNDPKAAIYATKGLTGLTKNKEAMAQSSFLLDRFNALPSQFVRPGKFGINKVQDFGGKILQKGDELPTRYIWNMFYEQGLSKGAKNAITYADDLTKQMVGGRGIGDISPAQRSTTGNLLFPFGVEWANSAHVLGDMVKNKEVVGLLTTIGLYHAFNKGVEKVTGTPAIFDPIQALFDSKEYMTGSDEKEQSTVKAFGRLVAEMANISPYSQNILSGAYGLAEMAGAPDGREIFGSSDPTRFGNVSLYSPVSIEDGGLKLKGPAELASKFNPYGGGRQVKKTVEGLVAGEKGYTESAAGNIAHSVDQDPLSRAQMALFGQWSTGKSREHFDSEYSRPIYDDERAMVDAAPKEQRPDIISQLNEKRRQTEKEKALYDTGEEKKGFMSKWFGGGEKEMSFQEKEPTTKEGKKAEKALLDLRLENDDVSNIPDRVIITHMFDGVTYDKADRAQQKKIFEVVDDAANNENLSEEAKLKIAQASKVDGGDLQYYRMSSLDQTDRLEMFVDFASQDFENREDLITGLALAKRKIGGKVLEPNDLANSLYDRGLISKEEKSLLNNVKYDPIEGKFYMDRDYKGGGGATASQTKARITALNNLHKSQRQQSQPISASMPKAPTLSLPRASQKGGGKTANKWFDSY